jgi:pimeloyl-ACP methyl ester carboxylesterase
LQFAHVNGVTIHYQVIGAAGKPLIVFANSIGTDFRIWRDAGHGDPARGAGRRPCRPRRGRQDRDFDTPFQG